MIVKRGKNAYKYQSNRVNGEVKTTYERKISVQELQAHEQRKEQTQQSKQREHELQQLNEQLETALKMIKIMERGYLLLAGYYTYRSELRPLPLQEEYDVQ